MREPKPIKLNNKSNKFARHLRAVVHTIKTITHDMGKEKERREKKTKRNGTNQTKEEEYACKIRIDFSDVFVLELRKKLFPIKELASILFSVRPILVC